MIVPNAQQPEMSVHANLDYDNSKTLESRKHKQRTQSQSNKGLLLFGTGLLYGSMSGPCIPGAKVDVGQQTC